jgi:F-type H+-transporting ATPase subunit epsilon
MKLTVTTPLAVAAEVSGVTYLRAEDETGAFGILPGHADFLTVLSVSVATWRDRQGAEHHVAVRGGMLQVRDGKTITIATREAIASDDLHRLETEVLTAFRRESEDERAARTDAQRLYLAAIRQICRFLKSERNPPAPAGTAAMFPGGFEP